MSTTYHTAIVDGASNAAATVNTPLGTIDAQLTTNTSEIVTARGAYTSLDSRLDSMTLGAGAVVATVASPGTIVASAVTLTVGAAEADAFTVGARVYYTEDAAGLEYGTVTSASGTALALSTTSASGTISAATLVGQITNTEYDAAISLPYGNSFVPILSDAMVAAGGGWYNVLNYGATTAGVDTSAAIQAALDACGTAGGGIVYLPPGTYSISASIKLRRDNVHIMGAGKDATVIQRITSDGRIFEASANSVTPASNVKISNMTLDSNAQAGWVNHIAIYLDGIYIHTVTVENCKFINASARYISTDGCQRLTVRDCFFLGGTVSGTVFYQGTAIYLDGDELDPVIENNVFDYVQNGVSGQGLVRRAHIRGNKFDLGWYLGAAEYTNSGATVSYTTTTVVDSTAPFPNGALASNITVRALSVKETGTGTVDNLKVTDAAATFSSNSVYAGEIIRFGTTWGVVARLDLTTPETVLYVEEWRDANCEKTTPPATGTYNVYKVHIGQLDIGTPNTTTTITVFRWMTMPGIAATPAAQSLYEVQYDNPTYALHAGPNCDEWIIEGNTVLRSWGDMISYHGDRGTITGNVCRRGQDMGIVTHGDNTTVAGNTIEWPGASGIWVGGNSASATTAAEGYKDATIVGNTVKECNWVDAAATLGFVRVSCTTSYPFERLVIADNHFYSKDCSFKLYGIEFLAKAYYVSITGNQIYGCTARYISVATNSKHINISGNVLGHEATRATYGVYIGSTVTDCVVSGNAIRYCTTADIFVDNDASGIVIADNNLLNDSTEAGAALTNPCSYGIQFDPTVSNSIIANNIIQYNQTANIGLSNSHAGLVITGNHCINVEAAPCTYGVQATSGLTDSTISGNTFSFNATGNIVMTTACNKLNVQNNRAVNAAGAPCDYGFQAGASLEDSIISGNQWFNIDVANIDLGGSSARVKIVDNVFDLDVTQLNPAAVDMITGNDDRTLQVTYSGNGAIPRRTHTAFLTQGSAQTMTLADPTAIIHDGVRITIVSMTGFAHVIDNSAGAPGVGFNMTDGAGDVATFTSAAIGDSMTVEARNGEWLIVASRGTITLS